MFASVDGDADRLVLFYFDSQGALQLLDGDKITALLIGFVQHVLATAGPSDTTVGCVQTAYANGASTQYIERTLGTRSKNKRIRLLFVLIVSNCQAYRSRARPPASSTCTIAPLSTTWVSTLRRTATALSSSATNSRYILLSAW
jgi:hypothetical protein